MNTFWIIFFSVCITICIASGAYVCVLLYEAITEDKQTKDSHEDIYNFLYAILASYGYNRSEEYMIALCQEIIWRIDYTCISNPCYKPNTDKDVVEDCDIIYGALVCAFGDYGTSPRYGWMEKKIAMYCVELLNAEIKENQTVIEMRGEE